MKHRPIRHDATYKCKEASTFASLLALYIQLSRVETVLPLLEGHPSGIQCIVSDVSRNNLKRKCFSHDVRHGGNNQLFKPVGIHFLEFDFFANTTNRADACISPYTLFKTLYFVQDFILCSRLYTLFKTLYFVLNNFSTELF